MRGLLYNVPEMKTWWISVKKINIDYFPRKGFF